MGYRLTRRERERSRPGNCTRCGRYCPQPRNTAGECLDCHNRGVVERRAARKRQIAADREQGRQFWARLGVRPGDAVEYWAPSVVGIAVRYVGVAKVGAGGAYVYVPGLGRLAPQGWRPVQTEGSR